MDTVVVTGCDHGLGVELVKQGMKVLKEEHGDRVTVCRMDVSSEASIRRAAAGIRRKAPRVDLPRMNLSVTPILFAAH